MFDLAHPFDKEGIDAGYCGVVRQMIANWRLLCQANPDAPLFIMWKLYEGYPPPGEAPTLVTLAKGLPPRAAEGVLKGDRTIPRNYTMEIPSSSLLRWELSTVCKYPSYRKLSLLDWTSDDGIREEEYVYCAIILLPKELNLCLVQVYVRDSFSGKYFRLIDEPLLYKG